jgi:hypothetical protein
MAGPSADRITEWEGGSLSELVTVLQSAALPVRIEVIAPGATNSTAGEVHLLAGGLADAFAGSLRRDDAVAALQRLEGARFLVECRLPDPDSGSLSEAGPGAGSLADRPLASLMRYCEEYVLTCRLEVRRGEDHAVISYRRGEIVSATVGDTEGSERLPEVLAWTEGSYEINLPAPVLPHVPGRTRENAVARPAERKRHSTLPLTPATEAKSADAVRPDGKSAPTATAPQPPATQPQATPASARVAPRPPAVPVAPLAAEMTTRGTPPVPPVPLHPAPAAGRPTLQGPGVQPAPSAPPASQSKPPAPPARPAAAPTTAPAPAKPAPIVKAPAAVAKPAPVAVPPAKPTQPSRPSQVAAPTPAAPVAPPAPVAVTTKAAPPTPATAAPASPAPSHAKAASAPSNDLMPASGTIQAKPKHANNLPPSTVPIQVAEQPGQPIVTTPAQPAAPAPSRPSEPRRQRVASRPKVRPHPVGAYVFVGLAIGIGIVLAYWAYWYFPFGH